MARVRQIVIIDSQVDYIILVYMMETRAITGEELRSVLRNDAAL